MREMVEEADGNALIVIKQMRERRQAGRRARRSRARWTSSRHGADPREARVVPAPAPANGGRAGDLAHLRCGRCDGARMWCERCDRCGALPYNRAVMIRANRNVSVAAVFALLLISSCASAPDTAKDEADVTATLDTFYGAMKTGDAAKAMSMIAQDAQFIESGKLETRDEYQEKNHLPLDIGFEKQVSGKRSPLRIRLNGNTAWVIASTEFVGTFDGRDLAFVSRQLAVLTREDTGWRIRSIHWSSQPL